MLLFAHCLLSLAMCVSILFYPFSKKSFCPFLFSIMLLRKLKSYLLCNDHILTFMAVFWFVCVQIALPHDNEGFSVFLAIPGQTCSWFCL